MTVRIDLDKKEIILGVKDLTSQDYAHSDHYVEDNLPIRAYLGRSVHEESQKYQSETNPAYSREVMVKYETNLRNFHIIIQGRVDGVYEKDGSIVVEEIKSVFNIAGVKRGIENGVYEAFFEQAEYYTWLLKMQSDKRVTGYLLFVGIADGQTERIPVKFNEKELMRKFENRISSIIREAELKREWQKKQREFAEKLEFPFATKREFQQEMMDEVEGALLRQQDIMISAPTGVGKTIAALFPALRYALHRGMRIFFVTSKTTQQRIVIDSLKLLCRRKSGATVINIMAKEKMCPHDDYFCHPDFCPFIREYPKRLRASTAIEELMHKKIITPEDVYASGIFHRLCPFELSLDVSLKCDAIVCDYNYVFDPSVYLRRFFSEKYDDSILIIDEAHNLYQRGMAYYSPELNRAKVIELIQFASKHDAPVFTEFMEILEPLEEYFKKLEKFGIEERSNAKEYLVNLDIDFFSELEEKTRKLAVNYYVHKKEFSVPVKDDPFQQFLLDFGMFCYVLSLGGDEFAHIYHRKEDGNILKILCCDPSRQLGERISGLYCTIAMSATLEPHQFYRDVLGFDRDRTTLRRFPSPFPKSNRKIIINSKVSTKYTQRHKFYEKIANFITDITMLREGNYLVFFPSYQFLENVYAHMPVHKLDIIVQQRSMSENERSVVITRLSDEKGIVVFAVQGGIFAEGVDYPGDAAIGAIIIGPGLPQYDFEQEVMKNYYQERYGMGFEYAYLYPGMNRTIQAAGRVIRSETDKGIIVLADERFATRYYNSLFPPDWYERSPDELISKDCIKDISQFWAGVDAI